MERDENCQSLEDDFASTFIRELMPGVLHNFANPLNGIMGRAKLLQRRIDDAVKKIEEKYPETAIALQDELNRIKNDIRSINRESDTFFDIFRDASGKFYALVARGEERINLSQLLAAEMRFANFYLEFKHEIRKTANFDDELPDFKGNLAEWSLVCWRLIRYAMSQAMLSENKECFLETTHDKKNITVTIAYSGESVPEGDRQRILQYFRGDDLILADCRMDKGVLLALQILKKNLVSIDFGSKNDSNTISLILPHHLE